MKALALEVFSKDEMGFINGGGDVTANKTIINADGSTTIITTTIKDDGQGRRITFLFHNQ